MRNSTALRLLIGTVLFIPASLVSTASLADTTTGTIRGTVTTGGSPVSGVNIRLFAAGVKDPVDHTKTDSNGTYEFTGVSPGDYQITTQLVGYKYQIISVDVVREITNVQDFTLISGSSISPSNRLEVLRRRIVDADGTLAPATVICLIDWQKRICSVTKASANGYFAFSGIPPGNYRIDFQHPGLRERSARIFITKQASFFMYNLSEGRIIPSYDSWGEEELWAEKHSLLSNRPASDAAAPAFCTPIHLR